MLLAVIIEVTSLCLAVPAGAVNKSSDEAVSRAVSKIGSKVGSGQCVALIYAYYEFLGVRPTGGNACDYAKKTPPEGFDTIQYYPGFVAKPGDIAVWTSTLVIKDGEKSQKYSRAHSNSRKCKFHIDESYRPEQQCRRQRFKQAGSRKIRKSTV